MRDYAKIKLTLSEDPDWRALTRTAQHLYWTLLTSATINNAGVADWRPNRMSALATGWTAEEIELDGKELEQARFIVIDEATEEVLVRSFVRHDGILTGPKTAQGMANAYRRVISLRIRSVICNEVARLRAELPDSGAWAVLDVVAIAENGVSEGVETGYSATYPAVSDTLSDTLSDRDVREYAASTPLHQPSTINHQPSTGGAEAAPPASAKPPRGSRIPADFAVTDAMRDWAKQTTPGIDVDQSTQMFRNHFEAKTGSDATKLDWAKTWQNWLLNDYKRLPKTTRANGGQRLFGAPGERKSYV